MWGRLREKLVSHRIEASHNTDVGSTQCHEQIVMRIPSRALLVKQDTVCSGYVATQQPAQNGSKRPV